MKNPINLFLVLIISAGSIAEAQKLDQFRVHGSTEPSETIISDEIRFNGYTNYWTDSYHVLHRYGNLFKVQTENLPSTIRQNKVDIAEELGIPGLAMQEGFITGLLNAPYITLLDPSVREMEKRSKEGNLLVYATTDSPSGEKLLSLAGQIHSWRSELSSHQFEASDYSPVEGFYLENGDRKIFAVISPERKYLEKFNTLLDNTIEVLSENDLHKGWMGTKTTYKSVGITFGHPLEMIGEGMNEGNSWFVFGGYNDHMAKEELSEWMKEIGNPIFVDVGSTTLSYISGTGCFLFGCDDYNGLQEQDITLESYLEFVRRKNGLIFRQLFDTVADGFQFDGFVAEDGNNEQINNEEVPFVHLTGFLNEGAASSMVLFLKKDVQMTRESMMSAILDRRAVAVLPAGKMMGPGIYRHTLQMLLLDRNYLEEYFGDRLSVKAQVDGSKLRLALKNYHQHAITGDVNIVLPRGLEIDSKDLTGVTLPAGSEKELQFAIRVSKDAMGKTNPIAIDFEWDGKKKSTLTKIDLPPVVSAHRLLYGQAPVVTYPVSVHNYTTLPSFPLKVTVAAKNNPDRIVFEEERNFTITPGEYGELIFRLELPSGEYIVTASALDSEVITQLGVEESEEQPQVYAIDLNKDGITEYRMENDSVKVTLLCTGARVIEYIVKSKDDNVFFKLWPDKPIDARRAFRMRNFYPFGGFEDFLGGASMESHKVFDAEIINNEGGSVSVRMRAEFYGNSMEKIFTLYGNSPLLEVRYTLDFSYAEACILAPQPILTLGKEHDPEDLFIVPDMKGIQEYRMKKEVYYGRMFNMKEGWNAGYDTRENIGFTGAFPVDQPEFMHMYMNHPLNQASHYYYVEFQPWIHIIKKNKMYFSYYMWASANRWENGLKELRKRNLITVR